MRTLTGAKPGASTNARTVRLPLVMTGEGSGWMLDDGNVILAVPRCRSAEAKGINGARQISPSDCSRQDWFRVAVIGAVAQDEQTAQRPLLLPFAVQRLEKAAEVGALAVGLAVWIEIPNILCEAPEGDANVERVVQLANDRLTVSPALARDSASATGREVHPVSSCFPRCPRQRSSRQADRRSCESRKPAEAAQNLPATTPASAARATRPMRSWRCTRHAPVGPDSDQRKPDGDASQCRQRQDRIECQHPFTRAEHYAHLADADRTDSPAATPTASTSNIRSMNQGNKSTGRSPCDSVTHTQIILWGSHRPGSENVFDLLDRHTF